MMFSYRQGVSFFHRLDPLAKLIWVLCVTIVSMVLPHLPAQAVLLVILLLTAFFLARVRIAEFGVLIWVMVLFCLSFFFIQVLTIPGENAAFMIGSFRVTWEAIDSAGAVTVRALVFVLMAMVFVTTTEPRDFGLMLAQRLHVSYVFSLMMFMFLRLFPLLEQELVELRAAHQLRGIEDRKGFGGYVQTLREYLLPMLTRGLRRGEITAYAMDSRAFRALPTRTYVRQVPFTSTGKVFSVVVVLLSVAALVLGSKLGGLGLWLATR